MSRTRVLSGIQPTGAGKHLGNYLGAVRHWAAMQDDFECFFFMADLHSLTITPDPAELRSQCRKLVAELLAMGVDPSRSTVFAQSHIPEHPELAWVLSCLTGFGEANRMTQFKEKGGGSGGNVGLFNYPILQAADILLYQANAVPVGEDQRQHLELTRTLAGRFNTRYGKTFTVPEPHIVKATAKIQDLQDPKSKMSKSATSQSGVISLLDDPARIAKQIRSSVTDTGREILFDEVEKPGVSNLLTILGALSGRTIEALEAEYAGKGYGDLKKDVTEVVIDTTTPYRDRTLALLADPAELDRILAEGADRARDVASATLARVYDRVGLLPSKR